jgi:hypothetical protein
MSLKPDLKLDWCSHQAALFAVRKWHYSKSLPPPPMVRVGVWENEEFIGCVLFARGANRNLLAPFGLEQTEGCELVRIALSKHKAPVTKIVSIAIRMIRKKFPSMRLILSFADPHQGHNGTIYQAGNWMFIGQSQPSFVYEDSNGKKWHPRMISKTGVKKVFGKTRRVLTPDQCKQIQVPGKFRYAMALDASMQSKLKQLEQPFPKRARSIDSDAPGVQSGEGGATPTRALSG